MALFYLPIKKIQLQLVALLAVPLQLKRPFLVAACLASFDDHQVVSACLMSHRDATLFSALAAGKCEACARETILHSHLGTAGNMACIPSSYIEQSEEGGKGR
ncbi:hypothetical protein PoB_003066100 [Plakobranchus ocellatus]|uniref:Secreted protein n=1 Tax=Plakobranchus ocellatus TaxID=259542 RepID=A0AAV4ABY1_9GAST|nr:hypothetical protein PoB_003066100 [Plakobranchus ocellatus]